MSSATAAAPRTSRSPSPSRSAVVTSAAPSKAASMVCVTQPPLAGVPSFSHQVMSSSMIDAPRTSRSPSPSRSAAATDQAVSKAPEMVWVVQPPSAGVPSFSHQVMSSARKDAPSTSRSPSMSTSATAIPSAPVECAGDGVGGPAAVRRRPVVLPPEHAGRCRGKHVEIAVAVQVRRGRVVGAVHGPVDRVREGNRPAEEGVAVDRPVLPPRDVVGIGSRAEDVEVAVTVQVRGGELSSPRRRRRRWCGWSSRRRPACRRSPTT